MTMLDSISRYAAEHGLSKRDSLQTFMQVIVLKCVRVEGACLIGGTALVLGEANPRFSEDIDLCGIEEPLKLEGGLADASKELSIWLNAELKIARPKKGLATWKIACNLKGVERVSLHVDSQPYPACEIKPIVVSYPGITPFVFNMASLTEIMADKLVALALRNYVGGRDLFDLWYHWLRLPNWDAMTGSIMPLLDRKLKERRNAGFDPFSEIRKRLMGGASQRMRYEWDRYLPANLKDKALYSEIIERVLDFVSNQGI